MYDFSLLQVSQYSSVTPEKVRSHLKMIVKYLSAIFYSCRACCNSNLASKMPQQQVMGDKIYYFAP